MSTSTQQVAILGAGRWGKAIAHLIGLNGHSVKLWSRSGPLTLTETLADTQIIIVAVAIKGVAPTIAALADLGLPPQSIVVTATKGLDPQTQKTPSQMWEQALPQYPLVVLSGPNLSKEITAGLPTATVVASHNFEASQQVQKILASERFRVYINSDPLGTELGGTLKNVMAIAAGVCDGLHLGTNAKAALLTRALPEMVRVGVALGAQPTTFFGLAGLGDLLATCSSPLSRNYQVGFKLAQGQTLRQIIAESEGVAEGINTTGVLVKIAKTLQISVPITQQVQELLEGQVTPNLALKNLMARDLTTESFLGDLW